MNSKLGQRTEQYMLMARAAKGNGEFEMNDTVLSLEIIHGPVTTSIEKVKIFDSPETMGENGLAGWS